MGSKFLLNLTDYSGLTLTNPTVPDKYKKVFKKMVTIGKYSIVGAGSIIMPEVILAEGTSVGAMSLVLKYTKPWGVYVGNSAKRFKDRYKDLLVLEKQYLENYGTQ